MNVNAASQTWGFQSHPSPPTSSSSGNILCSPSLADHLIHARTMPVDIWTMMSLNRNSRKHPENDSQAINEGEPLNRRRDLIVQGSRDFEAQSQYCPLVQRPIHARTVRFLTFNASISYATYHRHPRDDDPCGSNAFLKVRRSGSKYVTMTSTFLGLRTRRAAHRPKQDVKVLM